MFLVYYNSEGPYDRGKNIITHKGRDVATLLHSEDYLKYIDELNELNFTLVTIKPGQAHRPDLLAHEHYGSSRYYWLVMETNDVTDPYESLKGGDVIKVFDFLGLVI